MAWLARSFVNSLRADDGVSDDDDGEIPARRNADGDRSDEEQQPVSPTRGVKEDLSELTQTLTRQFWGVASFLAPSPLDPSPSRSDAAAAEEDATEAAESPRFTAIRSDLAEIGGRVRSGISMLSSNAAVSEISKIASTLFGSEDGDEEEYEEGEEKAGAGAGAGAVGVTEEVLGFVRNVSMHPETWLDFPLLGDIDDSDDFHMSDAQQEHALAVEHFVPRLAALRIELCPSHMNEGCFWKIYFVLLHPRLDKHDAELLSTPQIMQTRATLLQDLQIRTQQNSEGSDVEISLSEEVANNRSPPIIPDQSIPSTVNIPGHATSADSTEFETDKHPIQTTEVRIVEKSVIEEEPMVQAKSKDVPGVTAEASSTQRYEEDGDEWLDEEAGETGVSGGTANQLGTDEDVSFSDLEAEEDEEEIHVSSKIKSLSIGSTKQESDWVQLNKGSDGAPRSGDSSSSQTRGSNDWLDVDIDAV